MPEGDIEFLGKYFPYWVYDDDGKSKNPLFDEFSGLVLDLKNREEDAITYFYKKLSPLANKEVTIAVVPSHDPEKKVSGIRDLANMMCGKKLWIDATSCLKRIKKIPKLASGGNRNIAVHMESIKVINEELVKGKNVFLLDDVTTTGKSLMACKKLLESAGAKSVRCYAIGKTHWK